MNKFFMANHSPKGANASFAFGNEKKGGGFLLQDARIGNQEIYIGSFSNGTVKCLPFYSKATNDYRDSFVKADNSPNLVKSTYFLENEIEREYNLDFDRIIAKDGITDITFTVHTPLIPMPLPEDNEFKKVTAPLIIADLVIDNSKNDKPVMALFGVGGIKGLRFIETDILGVSSIDGYGFCAKKNEDMNLRLVCDFDPIGVFGREPEHFGRIALAPMPAFVFDVKENEKVSLKICLGFYLEGIVTQGAKRCSYYYTKYFNNIDEVFEYGLENIDFYTQSPIDDIHDKYEKLSDNRKFLLAHSVHSYYTSSMLFNDKGKPFWMINEGSFMMMSTFDLTIDHSFFDLMLNSWVVENLIDSYIEMISYEDRYGISFAHDFGSFNSFTSKGDSSYEISNQDGCFSFMTQEQLCNFILLCGLFYNKTNSKTWLENKKDTILKSYNSMINRDNPDKTLRNGIMSFDSDRCGIAAEITTFDSLDPSLGQARDSLYIAMKCFASYVILEYLLKELGLIEESMGASNQLELATKTICDNFDNEKQFIPAIFDGTCDAAIIPAIEALIYPYYCGLGDRVSSKLIELLKSHYKTIMKKGICIFDDGGWKLSSNNINSWMSKIFICQVVAEEILHFEQDYEADAAHKHWWTNGCKECPAIDQIFAGTTNETGFHYPRAVTSFLFL